jgi:hypothetical protein
MLAKRYLGEPRRSEVSCPTYSILMSREFLSIPDPTYTGPIILASGPRCQVYLRHINGVECKPAPSLEDTCTAGVFFLDFKGQHGFL